jgi:outer membrane lipoprotein-sorting protein
MAQKINTATTLHGIFDVKITGKSLNGSVNSEIWNAAPNKNRTVVLQSTLTQFPEGSVTVTNGKQTWQYDPAKKVVYTGAATPSNGSPSSGGQSQFILNIVQTVFTHSDATLVPAGATVNGHAAYDVLVEPQGQTPATGGIGSFNYVGDVYIDKTTNLPLRVNLTLQGFGQVQLDLPMLVLNQPIPDSTFTFIVPAGVKVLPLQQTSPTTGTGSLTLAQAQQQAGYHLLSISSTQTDYHLSSVNALGAPGSQIYTLNYTKGSTNITLAEGKPLANLPASGGQQVSLRGTTGTVATSNGSTTLSWTEHGIGLNLTAPLSSTQLLAIANLLS